MGRYSEFAALLSARLTKLDRSAAWLAARLGVDPATASRWGNGETRPKDPETVIRIADCLGVHDSSERQAWLVAAGYGYQEQPGTTADANFTPPPLLSYTERRAPPHPLPLQGEEQEGKSVQTGKQGGRLALRGRRRSQPAREEAQERRSASQARLAHEMTWLALLVIGLALMAGGTIYLLARQRNWREVSVGAAIGLAAALLSFVALALGRRWKHRGWPQLAAWVGLPAARDAERRPDPQLEPVSDRAHRGLFQVFVAALLVSDLVLWGGVVWAAVREAGCGPLGCQGGAARRFAIAAWRNLTRGASPYEDVWTEGTRRALYQKLSLLPDLAGISADSPQITEAERRDLDIWIDGSFQKIGEVALSAAIYGRGGQLQQTVSVSGPTDETGPAIETVILATQDELARKIIAALQVALPAASAEAIGRTPTRSAEALRLNNEAAVLILGGDTANAEPLLQEALALDPDYADAHNNLWRLLSLREDTTGAISEYQQASQLLPRYAVFHFNLGTAYRKAGQLGAAISEFTQAVALDPTYVKALNNLADAYLAIGDTQRAGDLLTQGLRLAPEAAYLHKNLGRVYLAESKPGQAIQALDAAIQWSDVPYAEALFYLAQAQAAADHRSEACAVLADYAQLAADDAVDAPDRPPAAKALAAQLGCPYSDR